MDDSDTNQMMFDLRIQPFRILRIEPTGKPIDSPGMEQPGRIDSNILSFKHEVLRDPTRRLLYELSCPIDCSSPEIEALYATLADGAVPTVELLQFADRLWPLARANFIAHSVSYRPADAALLFALLESHAAIDVHAIYTKVKASRAVEGISGPSLLSVRQGLDELFKLHAAAAFAGYDAIEDAVEPVIECTQQILADGERHLVAALENLLVPYRQCIDPLQGEAIEQVALACAALQAHPVDDPLVEQLAKAIHNWMSRATPLLMQSLHNGHRELEFDTPIEPLRALIADLSCNNHYQAAIRIVEVTHDLFDAVPTTIAKLAEDARLIEDISIHACLAQLQDQIDRLEGEPDQLIAALERDRFGQNSIEPAQGLWEVFLRATGPKTPSVSAESAWRLLRDFAIRLSNRPEAATAVSNLLAGMIEEGERVSVAPQFLDALRDNLNFMKSFIGTEPVEANIVASPTTKIKSSASIFFWRRTQRNASGNPNRKRYRLALAALAFLAAVACASIALEFDQIRPLWSKISESALALTLSRETMPPIGTGQHLALEGVRYCHFQKERLRVIKQQIQGPEDTRAYNLLIVDYNSRCSDFFYQDNDLKIVLAEVDAKRKLLEADADRIMSTWPGHTAQAETGAASIR